MSTYIDWRTPSSSPIEYTFPHPDRDAFITTADPQCDSLFFSLPPEIRKLIYVEFWRVSGLRQHIVSINPKDPVLPRTQPIPYDSEPHPRDSDMHFEGYIPPRVWAHVPCVTDPGKQDERYTKFTEAANGTQAKKVWASRLRSEWCGHWACEEPLAAQLLLPSATFLPVLLTSKRMYLESLPSLYSSLTFLFTDLPLTADFLTRYTPTLPLRSLELHIRATPLLTELYYPYSPAGPDPVSAGGHITMAHNPWARVCALLAQQPPPGTTTLHSLRIWFDTRDLRPWHKRVSETRLFAGLLGVRVLRKPRFLLELPELPVETRTASEGLEANHFFAGDAVLDGAPFTVVRGPRPNNWRVHFAGRG
ncbi:hypothetical protein B0T25DRAFT_567878 [Lasiosphaeria hispida]|uniref:Uncharacterized protein n=1 Tax=Lasiosphaeria hispida TaxID=260671 RepID=A0AAJ0MDY5_9PEZI|nr:hypothetical protein B0T25DRAFT_567878 [Lasiosphaeria hispida]